MNLKSILKIAIFLSFGSFVTVSNLCASAPKRLAANSNIQSRVSYQQPMQSQSRPDTSSDALLAKELFQELNPGNKVPQVNAASRPNSSVETKQKAERTGQRTSSRPASSKPKMQVTQFNATKKQQSPGQAPQSRTQAQHQATSQAKPDTTSDTLLAKELFQEINPGQKIPMSTQQAMATGNVEKKQQAEHKQKAEKPVSRPKPNLSLQPHNNAHAKKAISKKGIAYAGLKLNTKSLGNKSSEYFDLPADLAHKMVYITAEYQGDYDNSCGYRSAVHARAIQELIAANQKVTHKAIKEKLDEQRFLVKNQNIEIKKIMEVCELLNVNNVYFITYDKKATKIKSAGMQFNNTFNYDNCFKAIKNGTLPLAFFICNTGNHWVLAAAHNDKGVIRLMYLDSKNFRITKEKLSYLILKDLCKELGI